MKISSRFGALLALGFLVSAIPAQAQTLKEVTIGLSSPSMGVAGGRVAKELGLFEKHGINPRFVIMDSSSAAVAAMIAGSFKLTIAGFPELAVAQARGQNVVGITTAYGGFSTSYVLSKTVADKLGLAPNAPIEQRLKALDGLLLATPSATAGGTVSLRNAAQSVGANVRFTYMAQSAMQAALETVAVQGFVASAPFWANPIVKGTGVLWISGPKRELPEQFVSKITSQLQTMRDYADANPDTVTALRAVFADLAKAVVERPEEVKAAVARVYPDLDPKTIDILYPAESQGWNPPPTTVKDIARELEFVKATGLPLPNIERIDPASLIVQ